MHPAFSRKHLQPLFLVLLTAYFAASLGHFAHNAEFICTYPNLPAWLSSTQIYGTWAAITGVGLLGLVLLRQRLVVAGLALVAAYAAMGFDGLGHYVLAPIEFHPLAANISILGEVAAAALLLAVTLYRLALQIAPHRPRGLAA